MEGGRITAVNTADLTKVLDRDFMGIGKGIIEMSWKKIVLLK